LVDHHIRQRVSHVLSKEQRRQGCIGETLVFRLEEARSEWKRLQGKSSVGIMQPDQNKGLRDGTDV
jgi:hypothetical protein